MSLSILWISYSHDTQQPEILEPLPPLTSMYASWPPNIQYALCKPKIFVYDIPIKLQSQSYYKHVICTGSNYNSEVVLYEKLLKPGKIRDLYVTEDAEKADFFLIPFFGSCYLMNCWDNNNWNWTKRCNVDDNYAIPLMNHIIQDFPYWNRTNGKNHIMIHPMDHASLYYNTARHLMLNSTFLTTVGDKRPCCQYNHVDKRVSDIVVPSITRILNVANINPGDYLNSDGNPYSRNIFAAFRGCCKSTKPDDVYSLGIRSLLFNGLAKLPRYDIDEENGHTHEEYARLLSRTKYGLTPQGWTLDTTRLWEYLAFGVVPVIISDGIILPFENDVDWNRSDAHLIDKILLSIPEDEYQRKRKRVWEVGSKILVHKYSWHYIARELCRKMEKAELTKIDLD
ncbi:17876_t:CDS:2 [Entrophospora sp. SA101]|nr:17876_t:CDS:2 [Entrophospora sp. SA101]